MFPWGLGIGIWTLISKRDVDVASGLNHFAMRRNKSQAVHGVGDRNVPHLVILIADHRTEVSLVCELHGFNSEACAKNSVERGRSPAALQMSEHAGSRFFSSAFRDFARNHITNSTQPKFAAFDIAFNLLPI